MKRSWKEFDEERQALGISRAEMCRRAGISESTVTKGIKEGFSPIRSTRQNVELVLAAEKQAIDAGLRDRRASR